MRHGVIRIRTKLPNYSVIPEKTYDWDYTCYEGAEELIPDDIPQPLGKEVQTTTANWCATRLGWDESGTSWYQIDVGIQKSEIKIKII
jgi:hypothetical protein